VQPDFDAMRPAGVTNRMGRILTPDADAVSDESFRAGIAAIGAKVLDAVRGVMTCHPDHLVMGMSALTFFGGRDGADAFVREVREASGLEVTVGSHACAAALQAHGGVRRIAVLSPYWPVMNAEVARTFADCGYVVARDLALRCTSWTRIARVTPRRCRDAIPALDGDDVDAIVQVGTNLSMLRLAAAAELFLGKPVVAINAATYWHALRANGIPGRQAGLGRLLEQF
jgi:maleate isomerase